MQFTCEQVRNDEKMEAVRSVRRRVFIEEQAVPEEEEWDAFDATATHPEWLGAEPERLQQLMPE